MKSKLKLLLTVGTASLGLLMTACRAEAEETNAVAATDAPAATQAEETPPQEAAIPDEPGTDPGDTNIVINQEITVLEEVAPTTPSNLNLSKGVEAIVKLAQSGVSETVILTFIETTDHEYNLDAPAILYLNDIGISSVVIAAMLNHDGAPEELKDLLEDKTELADAPVEMPAEEPVPPISRPLLEGGYGSSPVASAPTETSVEVTTNYLPAEAQTVVQQPIVVEQPVVVQQPVVYTQPAVTHSYFYSSLAPYGSWIHVADYGWCWQPTIASTYSGWRPYTHGGRWLYSDAGWYWQSDYSWGWAPFHYGRWFSAPSRGWVWVPDYTWGPSWVTWRRTPYYCGWAPLPPRAHYRPGFGFSYFGRSVGLNFHFGLGYEHYSFVHKRNFCDRRLAHRVLPTHHSRNIYKDSTIINNYIVGNNNTIINRGVDRDVIARHARQEIPKVGIRDLPSEPGRLVQPDRLRKQGSELVVFRPTPPPASLAARAANAQTGRQEVTRGRPDSSQLVRPPASATTPASRDAVMGAGGRSALANRSEVARPPATAHSTPGTATPARSTVVPSRNPASATWAKPAPFVPPPAETPALARSATRSVPNREAAYNTPVNSSVRGGLVNTAPTRSIRTPTPVTRPSQAPAAPPATSRSGLSSQSTPSSGGRINNPAWTTGAWASRNESITRSATPAPSQRAVRPATPATSAPSTQSRLELGRRSTPSFGNSTVPGSNVGSPAGRAGIYGSPNTVRTPVTSAPSRSIAPSTAPSQRGPSPFNNPVTVRPAPVVVPQAPARPAQAPITVPTRPITRQESFSRPTVVPQTGRAASPVYQQPTSRANSSAYQSLGGRAAAPSYQSSAPSRAPSYSPPPVRSAPAPSSFGGGRAASPAYSAPPATGRGRMEIRR